MYECYSRKKLLCTLLKKREVRILIADDPADDVLFDDDGEETDGEEEFLEQSDNELSDEGMSRRISISTILSM